MHVVRAAAFRKKQADLKAYRANPSRKPDFGSVSEFDYTAGLYVAGRSNGKGLCLKFGPDASSGDCHFSGASDIEEAIEAAGFQPGDLIAVYFQRDSEYDEPGKPFWVSKICSAGGEDYNVSIADNLDRIVESDLHQPPLDLVSNWNAPVWF